MIPVAALRPIRKAPVSDPADAPAFDPFEAQRAVLATTHTAPEKLVALVLIQHMDREGTCWPSIQRLVKCTSLGRSTVVRSLERLTEAETFARTARFSPATGAQTASLYRWVPMPTVGRGSVTVVQAPCPPRAAPMPTVGHKHLSEQTRENKPKNGESAPLFSLSQIWEMVIKEHEGFRESYYDSKGVPERVSAEDREAIAQLILDAATEAREEWQGMPSTEPLTPTWPTILIREMFALWFEREGSNGYLRERAHPLTALRGDISGLHADWREGWAEQLAKRQAAAK